MNDSRPAPGPDAYEPPNPRTSLLFAALTVAVAAALLPLATDSFTWLHLLGLFASFAILEFILPPGFGDPHLIWVYLTAGLLHLIVFLLPATLNFLIFRRRAPGPCSAAIWIGCVLYLSFMFLLFPYTGELP